MKKIILSIAMAAAVMSAAISNVWADNALPNTPAAKHSYSVGALIYNGTAAATDDPESLAAILDAHGVSYQFADENKINSMSVDELAKFGTIIWPGGYAGVMSGALTQKARDTIRAAVVEKGVSFFGICAGSFIAVSPDTKWGFSLVTAPVLPVYHLEDEGTDDAMVSVKMNNGANRDLVWWGGPSLPEWPHGVIARYGDDNQPAMAEQWAGNGLVVLSAVHPEAPQSWRDKLGLKDQDGLDFDQAWMLIHAALTQQPVAALN